MPEAFLAEIKASFEKYENRFKEYRAIPHDKEALEAARNIVHAAVKENMWGLYRGEMLADLGDHYREQEFDPKAASKYFDQAAAWFDQVKSVDHAVTVYEIPGIAKTVTAPPPTMKAVDVWGNIRWTKTDIGDVVNRRSCSWYVDYFRILTHTKQALLLFIGGDPKSAVARLDIILKLDEKERLLFKSGWPNSYSRLKAEFEQERMFATAEDLNHFRKKAKVAIIVADFYYELELWEEAAVRYRQVDTVGGRNLDTTARAYLDLMLGYTGDIGGRNERWHYFKRFESVKAYRKTPSWPRAMLSLFSMYQGDPKTRNRALHCIRELQAQYRGKPEGRRALYHEAEFHLAFGRIKQAESIFNQCL